MTNFELQLHYIYIMKISTYLSYEAFPRIGPPPIPLIKKEEEIQDNNLVNIKLCCTKNNVALETYEFNMGTFELAPRRKLYSYSTIFIRRLLVPEPHPWLKNSPSYRPYSKEKNKINMNSSSPPTGVPLPTIYFIFATG